MKTVKTNGRSIRPATSTLPIPPAMHAKASAEAKRQGISVDEYVERALVEYLTPEDQPETEYEPFYQVENGRSSLGFRGEEIVGVVNERESVMSLKESARHLLNMSLAEEMGGVGHDMSDAGWQRYLGMIEAALPA